MIANFSQLHEDVHDREEVRLRKCLFGLIIVDILIIKEPLAPAQIALNDVLHFLW